MGTYESLTPQMKTNDPFVVVAHLEMYAADKSARRCKAVMTCDKGL